MVSAYSVRAIRFFASAESDPRGGIAKGCGTAGRELVGFERARNGNAIAASFDESEGLLGGALQAQLDFGFVTYVVRSR